MRGLCVTLFGTALTSTVAMGAYIPVDFTAQVNMSRFDALVANGSTFPAGAQTFSGVPFAMAGETSPSDPWAWNAHVAALAAGGDVGQTVSVTIPVNQFGVTDAYTLMSTYWGQGGPASYVSLTFTATNGVAATVPLIGNSDIRDYNQFFWTNSLNNVTSIEVLNNGLGQRVDMQRFALPSAFANETLLSITITDTGARNFQRAFISGLTVQIPSPAPLALAGGFVALTCFRRRR
jgi:hypothetical protein